VKLVVYIVVGNVCSKLLQSRNISKPVCLLWAIVQYPVHRVHNRLCIALIWSCCNIVLTCTTNSMNRIWLRNSLTPRWASFFLHTDLQHHTVNLHSNRSLLVCTTVKPKASMCRTHLVMKALCKFWFGCKVLCTLIDMLHKCVILQLLQISSYMHRSCKAAAMNLVSFVESGSIQDYAQEC